MIWFTETVPREYAKERAGGWDGRGDTMEEKRENEKGRKGVRGSKLRDGIIRKRGGGRLAAGVRARRERGRREEREGGDSTYRGVIRREGAPPRCSSFTI